LKPHALTTFAAGVGPNASVECDYHPTNQWC
jgi:hypothetical protein